MRKRKVNILFKLLFIVLAVFIALALIIGYLLQVLTTSDYFKVKNVSDAGELNVELSYLKGKNIFILNLPQESINIAKSCPDCLRVRFTRILPDRLFIEFVKRKPLALVKLYRYFAVDEDGVFFNTSQGPESLSLPLITGLEKKIPGIDPGRICKVKELTLAIAIIKEANKFRNLTDYPIQKIDVSAADDIAIVIPIDSAKATYHDLQAPAGQKILEVRISQGNIVEKIAVMSGLINQEKDNLANIKYIDLRFKEPVIKFKDAVK
jgi:hypothetical protein